MYIQNFKNHIKQINRRIKAIDTRISKLPEGILICYPNGKYVKWYHVVDKVSKWIPKKDKEFAEVLAEKKYLEEEKKDLLEEKETLESFLHCAQDSFVKRTEELINNPLYSPLLINSFVPESRKAQEWVKESYERNMRYPEQLKHDTMSGIKVRSKSERTIERVLFTHKIPFRYEPAMEFSGMILYPDFVILHPRTGELYIWEHFGMMDNPEYVRKSFLKVETYNSHGYMPTDKLIMTFENQNRPLQVNEVEDIVWRYFVL